MAHGRVTLGDLDPLNDRLDAAERGREWGAVERFSSPEPDGSAGANTASQKGAARFSRAGLGPILAWMLLCFTTVHTFYFASGVRFDGTPLTRYWQYLDVMLLRGRLAESLFYLHSQPPLFNLFLGLALKVAPVHFDLAFQAVFIVLGIALYLSLFFVMRRLGVASWLAFLLSTLFMASPSFVLYEEWLCHTFPVAVALTLSVLFLQALVCGGRWTSALGFVACLFFVCGTWALFHLAYLVVVAVGLAVFLPARRSLLLKAVAPVFALVLLLYVKNLVLFGHFGPSTWLGMNMARITLQRAPRAERRRLVDAGVLSELSLIRPFQAIDAYPAAYRALQRFEGVPSLSQATKSTGEPNFNHFPYIALSEQYLRDSRALVRDSPSAYARGLRAAWLYYFTSTSDLRLFPTDVERLQWPIRIWDRLAYGRTPIEIDVTSTDRHPLYLSLLVGLPLLLLASLWLAAGDRLPHGDRAVVLYMCFNIVWVAMVANSIEVGENNRFRFATDPLSTILLGLVLQCVLERSSPRDRGPARHWLGRPRS